MNIVDQLNHKRALVMGIINVTPDSFSDGGEAQTTELALRRAAHLLHEGADIIDVGGESTRPGAEPVSAEEELARVIPAIEAIGDEFGCPISIDTQKPKVMSAAAAAGAAMINDVNGLEAQGALDAVAKANLPVCIMHKQGIPQSMQDNPRYQDVVEEIVDYLLTRKRAAMEVGINEDKIIIDPGIGFGKTLANNLALLKAIPEILNRVRSEMLIGVSRKSMIGQLLADVNGMQRPVHDRVAASVGLAVQAALKGAKIIRVHDVKQTRDALSCIHAVENVQVN